MFQRSNSAQLRSETKMALKEVSPNQASDPYAQIRIAARIDEDNDVRGWGLWHARWPRKCHLGHKKASFLLIQWLCGHYQWWNVGTSTFGANTGKNTHHQQIWKLKFCMTKKRAFFLQYLPIKPGRNPHANSELQHLWMWTTALFGVGRLPSSVRGWFVAEMPSLQLGSD